MKNIKVTYEPDFTAYLWPDQEIPKVALELVNNPKQDISMITSQFCLISELLFHALNSPEVNIEFYFKEKQVIYDSLGFFVNAPTEFASLESQIVEKITPLRLKKLNKG